MDWDDLKIVLAAAREGSASRAAQALGVTVSTVTRRIRHLEEACDARLFARTPDGIRLTDAGRALMPHAEAAERAVLAGEAAVSAVGTTPTGEVTVALPIEVLCLVVLPQMPEFEARFPDVRVTWRTGPEVLDLPRREADIAVRAWRPKTDDVDALIVRRVRGVPVATYGTPEYLATVENPADVTQHRWLGSRFEQDGLTRWVEAHGGTVTSRFESPLPTRLACACGLGAALLPVIFAEVTPGLERFDVDATLPDSLYVYLVTHRAIRHAPAVAALWEFLVQAVGGSGEDVDIGTLDEYQRRYFR